LLNIPRHVRRLEIAQSTLHGQGAVLDERRSAGPDCARCGLENLIDMRANYGTTLFSPALSGERKPLRRIAIMHQGKLDALGTCKELKLAGPGTR